MKRLMQSLFALLFPKKAVCMGCDSAAGCREDWICPECRQMLAKSWVGAEPPPKGIDGAAYANVYRGPAARIVRRLKYSGVTKLAEFMGEDMVKAYRFIEPTGADCVTCVPMHRRRLRRRGYNHAELLARDVARRLGIEYIDALQCIRPIPQQARLDKATRRRNLKDAIVLKADVAGRRVILVDDVRTTGTTARTCASVLKTGGAAGVYLLCYTVARGEKQ